MNKMIRTLLTLAALGAGSTLLAQPAVKLIVVDMAKVYDSHYKTEEANAKFRDAEQKAQEQVEEMNKQGQILVDEYKELIEQSKNTVLTAEARSKAEADAQKKIEDIQRKQGAVQKFRSDTVSTLQQRVKNHRDLLLEDITKVVNDIAKKKGATLVVDKSGPTLFGIPSVLYADPAFDITEEVVKETNKDRPAASATPAAPAAKAATPAATTPAPATGFNVPGVTTPPAKKN
ncbi:OmpH family outer membrane protein [Oleiharenicola lentus]|uniref:OmpH family outer membrane protein n=1 Tax=Oleiharenicola lentus TaxID=2508720 RepID=UPI003F668FA6